MPEEKEVNNPDPTQKVIKAIQEHGKSLGKLIESSNKTSERFTKSIIFITWAIFLLALLQFLINLLPTQSSFWVILINIVTVVILVALLGICVGISLKLFKGK